MGFELRANLKGLNKVSPENQAHILERILPQIIPDENNQVEEGTYAQAMKHKDQRQELIQTIDHIILELPLDVKQVNKTLVDSFRKFKRIEKTTNFLEERYANIKSMKAEYKIVKEVMKKLEGKVVNVNINHQSNIELADMTITREKTFYFEHTKGTDGIIEFKPKRVITEIENELLIKYLRLKEGFMVKKDLFWKIADDSIYENSEEMKELNVLHFEFLSVKSDYEEKILPQQNKFISKIKKFYKNNITSKIAKYL